MIKELTETEFKSTCGRKMTDVTETAEPIVDIWNYVEELVRQNIVDKYVADKNLVETVYRNDTSTFDHVLLPTNNKNIFIVVIVDLNKENIFGYYKLNLEKEYSRT